MAKKRFRRSHHASLSPRSFFEQQYTSDHLTLDRTELLSLIHGGEDSYVELKVRLNNIEKVAAEVVALANSGGGFIIFGVTDQRRIEGLDHPERVEEELVRLCHHLVAPALYPCINKISFDNGKRVIALEVKGPHRPYFTQDQRCYIRAGSVKREATQEEISDMYDPHVSVGYELIPVLGATLDDIDEGLFWSYIRAVRGGDLGELESNGYPVDVVMSQYLKLAVPRRLDTVPTLSGMLLFGKDSRMGELWPRARVITTRLSGILVEDPIVEQVEMIGNLAQLYEKVVGFILKYADLSPSDRPPRPWTDAASPVSPRAVYPRRAVLEAIANMVVHRDYTLREGSSRVLIFDDRIEILNPARSNAVSVDAFCYGLVEAPYPRTKAIFKSPYYGLETATGGLPMILHSVQTFTGLRPEIRVINDEFRVRLHGWR